MLTTMYLKKYDEYFLREKTKNKKPIFFFCFIDFQYIYLDSIFCYVRVPSSSSWIPHMAVRLLFFITSTDNLLHNIYLTVLLKS